MPRSKIIIVGGGLGGLAAALALAQKQFDVTVLEQADQFREVGAGIQLGPNVLITFKALDLVNPIEELAVFPDALLMRDAITANEITRIPINTASFKKQFSFPYGVIYRPDLLNVTKRACEQFSNIKIIFNKRVLTTRQTANSASVICEDQSLYDAEGIIGAGGLWSEIRKNIVNNEAPRVSGHIAYRAVLPLNEVPDKARENEVLIHRDTDIRTAYDGPLAVLVNRGSASASEIFAGAIQDYDRGVVLGSQTFGKGSVQQLLSLNHGQLKVTEAMFYRINGESVQRRGVIPDIFYPSRYNLEMVGEETLDDSLPYTEVPVSYTHLTLPTKRIV